MTRSEFPYEVGDEMAIASWGRLSKRDLAQHGIDVLVGMIRDHHKDCPSANHFWCAPQEMQVFLLAELYQADNDQGEHYIGCYFSGADFDNDGIPRFHESPSLKAVIQRFEDGHALVRLGQPMGCSSGAGMLDQRTAELLVVTPDSVPNVPEELSVHASFVLRKLDDVWTVAHFFQDEGSTEIEARVIAQFLVDPSPSPFTVLQMKDFPTVL